jgi:hypothetical protein
MPTCSGNLSAARTCLGCTILKSRQGVLATNAKCTRLLVDGRSKKFKGVKPWKSHPRALTGETGLATKENIYVS